MFATHAVQNQLLQSVDHLAQTLNPIASRTLRSLTENRKQRPFTESAAVHDDYGKRARAIEHLNSLAATCTKATSKDFQSAKVHAASEKHLDNNVRAMILTAITGMSR